MKKVKAKKEKKLKLGTFKETAREKMIGQHIGYRYDVNLLPDYKKAGINEAANGILLSSIMRLADSNVKNYAFSVSVFVVVGFSALISDDYWPNPSFYVGAVLVILSMAMYSQTDEKKKA